MKKAIGFLLILVCVFLNKTMHAQGSGGGTGTTSQVSNTPAGSRAQRSEDRKKWKAERKKKHQEEKAIKDYQKHSQTKATRKRMKETKHKSELVNDNKREFFLKRWFKNRKPKKTKKQDR